MTLTEAQNYCDKNSKIKMLIKPKEDYNEFWWKETINELEYGDFVKVKKDEASVETLNDIIDILYYQYTQTFNDLEIKDVREYFKNNSELNIFVRNIGDNEWDIDWEFNYKGEVHIDFIERIEGLKDYTEEELKGLLDTINKRIKTQKEEL